MRFILWVLLSGAALWPAELTKSPVTAADLLKIQRVTDVEVTRDGSFAVYGVQSIHVDTAKSKDDPSYEYRTNLWEVDLAKKDSRPRQLTYGARADTGIAISPDGMSLAFVRADPEKKKPQVWLMPLHGSGEAHMITSLENGAVSPVWRPDGKSLLVSSPVPLSKVEAKPPFGLERPGRQWFDWDRPAVGEKDSKAPARPDGDLKAIRNWLERNAARDNPTAIYRLAFQAEQGLEHEMRVPQLYFVDLAGAPQAKALQSAAWGLTDCSFSPDGRKIACAGWPASKEHPDRSRRGVIWMMDTDGSNGEAILDQTDETFQRPRFYPGGKALLVTTQRVDEPTYRQSRLARYELESKKLTWISQEWGSSVQQANVASDGSVLFTSSWHGGVPLMRIHGSKVDDLVSQPAGVTAYDEGGGRVVYALTSVPNPNELYVRDKDGGSRQLTHLNSKWLAAKHLSLPEEKWITRPDGTKVQMWVMNPLRPQAGKKYPWVLDMHGGPTAMWGPGEFSMWHEFQLFCAWGYGVVYANPRGSGGYGYDFQKANFKNWGEGPAADVLAALDETMKTNPYVDADRLFLTGGSYAGYLAAWIVGHDHRFKAAAAQRGVYDLTTFYGEGNAFRLVEGDFGGRPYDPETRKLLDQQSPFTYVRDIRTPLLILHGSEDRRTGVSQGEMLYRALKDMHKPVEYVRYPGIGHELTRSGPPLQRMDHMLRIIEFFERYSKNETPPPVVPDAPATASESGQLAR